MVNSNTYVLTIILYVTVKVMVMVMVTRDRFEVLTLTWPPIQPLVYAMV